ncbi:MAG TPA: tRNA lysidine(34) synthetase TilS [Candidatus Krumholzibacteria bacterium]|nr:tRNA lysidine(34) synthetase TilS [Candidatus Krumholzibacteria bacterium]HRX49820.1 tRNA lysidine(34) synthetase TilS [Candidatus Krumholzibacteria bacterium]
MPPSPASLTRAVVDLDRLLPSGAGVLVALSGGPDSVLLLRAAAARRDSGGGPVEAAHLHHGLRGADADADAAFCADLCARLGIPLHRESLAWPPGAAPGEAALRDARHAFLRRVLADRPPLAAVALGHHADDQAETVLLRLFRGTGPDGLRAMAPRRGSWVRPLLRWTRAEVEAVLTTLDQPWRIDATNVGDANLRARLRRDLVPVLREIFGPSALAGPARTAAIAARDAAALDRLAAARRRAWDRRGLPTDALPWPIAAHLPPALLLRVVRRIVAEREPGPSPLTEERLTALAAWLPGSGAGTALELGAGWRAVRSQDLLRIVRGDATVAPRPRPRLHTAPGVPADLDPCAPEAGLAPPDDRWRLALPAAALRGRARLRPWRPGDRLRPIGLDGTKKVSDLLREARVPRDRRGDVLLVEDDDGPLWLVGLARDERTRWLPHTDEAVTLTVGFRDADARPDAD